MGGGWPVGGWDRAMAQVAGVLVPCNYLPDSRPGGYGVGLVVRWSGGAKQGAGPGPEG